MNSSSLIRHSERRENERLSHQRPVRMQAIADAARSELNAYLVAATSAANAASGGAAANREAANGDAAAAPVFHPDAEKFMLRQQLQVCTLLPALQIIIASRKRLHMPSISCSALHAALACACHGSAR